MLALAHYYRDIKIYNSFALPCYMGQLIRDIVTYHRFGTLFPVITQSLDTR